MSTPTVQVIPIATTSAAVNEQYITEFILKYMCPICKGCRTNSKKCFLCEATVCEGSNYSGCSMRKRTWYSGNYVCNKCWSNERKKDDCVC